MTGPFRMPQIERPDRVIEMWRDWCGDSAWTRALERFGELGGLIEYWCGLPRSASSIPLTFALYRPDGSKLPCEYRLKDIRAAIATLEAEAEGEPIPPVSVSAGMERCA